MGREYDDLTTNHYARSPSPHLGKKETITQLPTCHLISSRLIFISTNQLDDRISSR